MDKQTLLAALTGTLASDQQIRKHSEQQLHAFEQQPGFTAYLLDLITDATENQPGLKTAAAIFFKTESSITGLFLKTNNTLHSTFQRLKNPA